ncbi:hypothetical protein QBC46DRAFT_396005 [Diplogelasinospora grovesii]|uniref:Uncharacterized protein n=1 Tax=Diplogelasinospora grovesii TaxID=303347 RepID=A0AAN6S188_9PEZI|nr:hypothetical protein QBC46DRAFT_396005 [Diplogelasinospora grovesii]
MRIGFLTTSPSILQKVSSAFNLPRPPQVLALALLRHWGHEGFLTHASKAADFYRRKRDVFVAAAERHLRGKATWEVPTAGMFLWICSLPARTASRPSAGLPSRLASLRSPGWGSCPARARRASFGRASVWSTRRRMPTKLAGGLPRWSIMLMPLPRPPRREMGSLPPWRCDELNDEYDYMYNPSGI